MTSIAAQTAPPDEIILVDDGNIDPTAHALHWAATRSVRNVKVTVLRLDPNVGAASARNAGWDAASTPYVAFLDADDSWHPRKLEIQVAYMESHPDVVVSGHRHDVCRAMVQPAALPEDWSATRFDFSRLLWSNRFVTSSAVVRRETPHRFAARQRHMEDHRLWLDIARAGLPIVRLEVALAAHHKADFGAGGLSGDLVRMERAELSNYAALHRAGAISAASRAALTSWSLAKFVRRVLIVGTRTLARRTS